MEYGFCFLGIVPLYARASHKSEMVSQVLFGELYTVIKKKKSWVKIQLLDDDYQGWIIVSQHRVISETDYNSVKKRAKKFVKNTFNEVKKNNLIFSIPFGANIAALDFFNYKYEGAFLKSTKNKKDVIKTAFYYLNAPYLWGGKTSWGIDCSGFTQMVYKMHCFPLKRDADKQSQQGKNISSLSKSERGDLAFFGNKKEKITHVGIILNNKQIIHACGTVRVDSIDSKGIYNITEKKYTHRLHFIKRFF